MATTTSKTPARRTSKAPTRSAKAKPAAMMDDGGETTLDYLQKAVEDLDQARELAGKDMRSALDNVMHHMRDIVGDVRKRAEEEASDWQKALESTTEDMRRDLGRRAVRAQQTPDALTELSAEIKKRRSQLSH